MTQKANRVDTETDMDRLRDWVRRHIRKSYMDWISSLEAVPEKKREEGA